jgi:glycosyltransferase involved in cell wall biosynthesis
MNIAITSTHDSEGGAARYAYRLHRELLHQGINSGMLVRDKFKDDPSVIGITSKLEKLKSIITPKLDALALYHYPNRNKELFTPGIFGSFNLKKYQNKYDIFNIHWVAGGFQNIESIGKITKPVVITLHDSWAFTGGCHVPFDCSNFLNNCGRCPLLHSKKKNDLSARSLLKKKRLWDNKNIVVVGGGGWITENAKKSTVFQNSRVETIHPGLDINVYKPLGKNYCREILGLNISDKVILFGAVKSTSDKNKGFQMLILALKKLISTRTVSGNLKLVVFGATSSFEDLNIGIDIQYVGKMHDDISLSILYSAADLMIVPSIQESFGQTASESFSCGTPVVAFDTSGLKDIIDHQVNGYLAKPFDTDDLANGIEWMLEDSNRLDKMGIKAREKAINKFDIKNCANSYIKIFESVIK